jgi:phosphoribosylformylglycinamidine synthase
MDFKEPGNDIYLVGVTKDETGGSHYHLVTGQSGGNVPRVDPVLAPTVFRGVHEVIVHGLVRSCHDLSEGGLAVAAAEMAFAGGVGADLTDAGGIDAPSDAVRLFSESTTRFLVEVRPTQVAAFLLRLGGVPVARVGKTVAEQRLRIAGADGSWVVWAKLDELKEAWQKPLRGLV